MLNRSAVLVELGSVERTTLLVVTTLPCCVFLFVNGTLLFTLRWKAVFCETPRYLLLTNLLLADTVQLALSQAMYTIAALRARLSMPVCGLLTMVSELTLKVSPLTLVLMSLERYVAVCFPLRHAAIVTLKKSHVAVGGVWVCSALCVFVHVVLLLEAQLGLVQMNTFCAKESLLLSPKSALYERVQTCIVFVCAGISVIFSYIGVLVAAHSATTDQASARKAHSTLLLHVAQLGLSLLSTIHSPILISISRYLSTILMLRIQIFLYVLLILLPRCLSTLIYGLRDQTIRPVLLRYLLCMLHHSKVSP